MYHKEKYVVYGKHITYDEFLNIVLKYNPYKFPEYFISLLKDNNRWLSEDNIIDLPKEMYDESMEIIDSFGIVGFKPNLFQFNDDDYVISIIPHDEEDDKDRMVLCKILHYPIDEKQYEKGIINENLSYYDFLEMKDKFTSDLNLLLKKSDNEKEPYLYVFNAYDDCTCCS